MPQRLWRHVCRERIALTGSRRCFVCGDIGVFERWHLGMWEAMSVYCRVYRLNPIGPHRRFADLLLGGMRDCCATCGGHCIVTISESEWRDCRVCDGTGGTWNCDANQIERARQRVLARWPQAALSEKHVVEHSGHTISDARTAERDTSLEEYKQHLWRSLRHISRDADRQIVVSALERLNAEGRAALKDL